MVEHTYSTAEECIESDDGSSATLHWFLANRSRPITGLPDESRREIHARLCSFQGVKCKDLQEASVAERECVDQEDLNQGFKEHEVATFVLLGQNSSNLTI
jgi:hypothetical protein